MFDFLFILDDYGKVLCFSVNKQNGNVSSNKEQYIPRILTLFVVNLTRVHFTFVAVCLLSAVRKQQLKQYNYHVDQSELLTRFWTDFTSLLLNCCRRGADVSPGETSPAVRTEARRLFSRAKYCAAAVPDLQIRGGGVSQKNCFGSLDLSLV